MIREFWARPRFDLETDAWVVENEPGLVGYGEAWDMTPAHLDAVGFVHPEHMGRGIGSFLATLIETRAAEKATGAAQLFSAVIPQDKPAARLLGARGYVWARRFRHMEIELESELQTPTPPSGIQLRRLDPESDLPHVHQIFEASFQDHWGYSPTSFEKFLAESVRGLHFDPALWIVATDDDKMVAVIYGEAHSDRGWIIELGVLPSHRGRGIATALLRKSFAEFQRRGLPRVRLNVDSDNSTGAVALYERVGMREVASFDLWALDIQGGRG